MARTRAAATHLVIDVVGFFSTTEAWALGGNSGTTPGTHFLGTTDDQALELRVNNDRGLRLEPAASPESGEIRPNLIGGSDLNSVTDGVFGATISGGGGDLADVGGSSAPRPNRVTDHFGTIGGGLDNQVGDGDPDFFIGRFSTVGGGLENTASGLSATVSGGIRNTANGGNATVAGGLDNTAGGTQDTVGGGINNITSGPMATIGGGSFNTATGSGATVPGGASNTAAGDYSLAGGRRAEIDSAHDGTFLWADNSTSADFTSARANEFSVRAAGGYRFYTASDLSTGATMAAGAGSWSSVSARATKENFARVDGKEVLAALSEIPIETWNWKVQGSSVRHMGPMAEDFSRAFGLGEDPGMISTVDADGVALAAIQGLHEKVRAQEAEIAALRRGAPSPLWVVITGLLGAGFLALAGVVVLLWRRLARLASPEETAMA